MKRILGLLTIVLAMCCFSVSNAQTTHPPVNNFYAGGISYNVGATPSIAGTGLQAHLLSSDTGTYEFSVIDALPNTIRPFTVSTNIGVGIAQKLTTVGKVAVYVPTAAGVSFNGNNTGWQWNAGCMGVINVKNNYYLGLTARFLKSSVTGGTGYQPIIGVVFGFGQ